MVPAVPMLPTTVPSESMSCAVKTLPVAKVPLTKNCTLTLLPGQVVAGLMVPTCVMAVAGFTVTLTVRVTEHEPRETTT